MNNITIYKKLLKDINSVTSLKQLLIEICVEYKCDYIAYGIKINNSFEENQYIVISNYPEDWVEQYISNNYASIDPVIKHCISDEKHIFWHELRSESLSSDSIKFWGKAKSYGLTDGISKGLKTSQNEIGIMNLSKNHTLTPNNKDSDKIIQMMTELQPYIHHTFIRLSPQYKTSKEILLTTRELESLHYMVKGYTSSQIGSSLNISESTVVFHIKNIIEKLDAQNRTQAVAKAVLIGLVHPNDFYEVQENAYFWES